jgi:hypothetical protein
VLKGASLRGLRLKINFQIGNSQYSGQSYSAHTPNPVSNYTLLRLAQACSSSLTEKDVIILDHHDEGNSNASGLE